MLTIDWDAVEKDIRSAIRGERVYNVLFKKAFLADSVRYKELYARVKAEEMQKVNPYL